MHKWRGWPYILHSWEGGSDRGLNTGRRVDVLERIHGSSLPVASIFLSDIQSKDTDMRNLLKLLEIQEL